VISIVTGRYIDNVQKILSDNGIVSEMGYPHILIGEEIYIS